MPESAFLLGLAIAGTTFVMVARAIAGAIGGRAASRVDLAHVTEKLDQHATALQDIETSLANLGPQLAELQERIDFTERLLAQARERSQLGAAETRE